MEKTKAMRQCGTNMIEKGKKFQAAEDSEAPETTFEIIETDVKDEDGFDAVKLQYNDGSIEIAAIEVMENGINNHGLRVLN